MDTKQSDKGIYLRFITWSAFFGLVVFGMILWIGKSIVKNQTVDFPHLPLLTFGPNVKNMMKQVGMIQTSSFSSFFFFSFIHIKLPWSLMDQLANLVGILKAKAKHMQYTAKIKQRPLNIAGGSAQS